MMCGCAISLTQEQFLSKAIAIHGDKFDYSITEYTGQKNPLRFICRKCGTVRRLSQAGTHIRARKPCGCKPCNHERMSPCKQCGCDVSSKVYHAQGKRCKSCVEESKAKRKERVEQKNGKHCKTCGVWFVYKDRSYCSKQCRDAAPSRAAIGKYTCKTCGCEVVRQACRVKNPSIVFCSKQCQSNAQRGTGIGFEAINRPDTYWARRSKAARQRWVKERRGERKQASVRYRWFVAIKDAIGKKRREASQTEWDRRVMSAVGCLRTRREPVFRLQKQKTKATWDVAISKARTSLRVSVNKTEDAKWSVKIHRTVKSCKRRFEAKSKRNAGRLGFAAAETVG